MKFKEMKPTLAEEKVRLDPKCWKGKKIGNPKTKMKGGVRVNNCVPAESITEDIQADDGTYYKNADDFFGQFEADWFDDEVTSPDGMEIRGYIDGVNVMAWRYQSPKKIGGWGNYDDSAMSEAANPAQQAAIAIAMKKKGQEPKNENAEYDDEAGMADNNLETLRRAVDGLDELIGAGDNLPEWCQEKIAVAKSMLVAVWDYMASEEVEDPEITAMYEAMEDLVTEMAAKNNVSADLVWEQFEALPDNVLYETAAWRRKEGKSKSGGLNAKGVASYRRENPGSKLQMAVTTKPSKLKKGSKAAKRRKSFCARMSGVKGPMKKPNGKPTRKALALRKWNC